jgi:hypothetical protein
MHYGEVFIIIGIFSIIAIILSYIMMGFFAMKIMIDVQISDSEKSPYSKPLLKIVRLDTKLHNRKKIVERNNRSWGCILVK